MFSEAELATQCENGHAGRTNALRVLRRGSQGLVAVYQQGERLVFECGQYRTHAVSFPPDWYDLSDDRLVSIGRALSPGLGECDELPPAQQTGARRRTKAYRRGQGEPVDDIAALAGVTQIIERVREHTVDRLRFLALG